MLKQGHESTLRLWSEYFSDNLLWQGEIKDVLLFWGISYDN